MKPNKKNKIKKIKRAGTLIVVLLLTLISLTLTLSENENTQKLLYLSVEKPYYNIGEKITLIITAKNLNDYELTINSKNSFYKYSGELSNNIEFYPKEYGLHIVELTNKLNQSIADSLQFITINPAEKNKTRFISTNKREYTLGETVMAVVNIPKHEKLDKYKLYYEYNGFTQRYMGDLTEIRFVPKGVGTHHLILKDKDSNKIIESYEFKVVKKEETTKQLKEENTVITIKDGKGRIVEAILKFYDKANTKFMSANSQNYFEILKKPESVEIIPKNKIVEKIMIRGLKSQNIALGLEKVHPLKNPIPGRIPVKTYAIDPTQIEFTNATITQKARGTELWKCKDYNFTTQTCFGTWKKIMNIIPGENYTFLLTPEDPLYSETRTNVPCSCQDSATSVRGVPARATCSVFCNVTIDVPPNAETGYIMNMSYGIQLTYTGDTGFITSASQRARFDRDQTYGNGNESSIGTDTSTTSFTTTWTNSSLNPTGSAAFNELTCDNWANTCTWYVYLYSTAVVDAPGSSTKSITMNISLLNMSYAWNYTELGNLSVTLNWPDGDYINYYNITFNYTPVSTSNITNCTLYTNRTGSFTNESTDYNISNNQSNYFNLSFSNNGRYLWNVLCYDDSGNNAWAPNNKSFIIDTVKPTVNLESPEDNNYTTNTVITFYYNVSDSNSIKNCSLIIDGSPDQTDTSISKGTSQNFSTSLSNGVHTWAVWCYDDANNLGKSENRTINVSAQRKIWSDRWYETGTSSYTSTTANIELNNETDGTQNQVYYDIPALTTITLVDAISPYISGDGAYIYNNTLVTFRAAFAAAQSNGRLSWHLYILHANNSQTEVCSYGDDASGGATVVTITEATCNTTSDYRLLGTDRLELVLKVYNTHNQQNRDVTHYFDNTNSYVEINNFITLGHLETDLIAPSSNLDIDQNTTYTHTCNVTCVDGTCLNVSVYAQYNSTSPTSNTWTNISSTGYLVLNGSETNPHNTGNLSSNTTNTTFIILGNEPSTNYIRCYAKSKFSSDTSQTIRRIRIKDTIGPVVNLTSPSNQTYTKNNTINFYFFVSDPSELRNCSLILNGMKNKSLNSSQLTNNAINNITVNGFSEGTDNWTVNCTDIWNNTGTDQPYILYIDRKAPLISLNFPAPNDTVAYSMINFNWTAYDNYNVNMTCDLYINGSLNVSGVISPNGTPTNTTTGNFSIGTYLWYMNCSDPAGNWNVSETRNFTVIDLPPTTYLIFPTPGHYNDSSTIIFLYNASDNNGFKNCTLYIDGAPNATNSTIYNNQINNFTVNNLPEGLHNWTVSCIDTGGYNDTAAWQNFTIDLTNPYVLLNYPDPAQLFTDADVTFSYNATDNIASTLDCELFIDSNSESNDTATNATPTAVNINNIRDGLHYWNVTCTDYANRQNTSETRNFTINESPSIILNSPTPFAYTNENVTFTYTPDDNDGFTNCTLYIDGAPNATNNTIYNNQINNFTVNNLPEGNHTWYIGCYDNGTYQNYNVSQTRNFTVDTSNPTIILNYPGIEELVQSEEVNFNFTANDNYDTLLDCDLYINGLYNQTAGATAGNDTIISLNLTNGRYNWSVVCKDDVNNSNTSETRWFNVSVPPSINLTYPTPNEHMNFSNQMFEYIPRANANITNCTLFLDGQENETNNSITPDTYNYFWVNIPTEGKHNWTVRCIDENGLQGWSGTQDFYLDFTKPSIQLYQPGNGDTVTRNLVLFNFTATDSISENMLCNLTVNGGLEGTSLNVTNATSYLFNRTFPDGNYSWYVECRDKAGNYNISETWNFTIIAPPNVTLLYPPNEKHLSTTYINLTYLPEDDYVIPNCTLYLNGSPYMNDTSIDTNQNNTFDISSIGEGYYNWTVYCTDQDSNTYGPPEWNFTIDRTPPAPVLYLPNPRALLTSEDVLFNFTAIDSLDTNLYCNLTINGSVNVSNVSVTNDSWRNITIYDLQDSIYFWNITCWDRAFNNQTSETRNFTVQSPPRIALGNPEMYYRTNTTNIMFFFTPTDNSGNITNCTLILNGQPNETLTPIINGAEHNITVSGLQDGTYNWTVNCTDINGNEGTNTSLKIFYVDLTGPNITLNFPSSGQIFGYDDITFNWTPIDFNNTNITCNLTLDDNNSIASITNLSGYDFITTIYALQWGTHFWNVTCWDDLGNNNTSETRNFTITRPDLTTSTGNITFNNTNPDENDSILINTTIYNLGGANSNNTLVQFWDGKPGAGGVWIANITIDIPGNSFRWVNTTWNISLGFHTIWVTIDPDNIIEELNDSNNNATKNISVLRVFFNSPSNGSQTNDTTPEINFTMQDFTGGILNYTIYVDGSQNGQTGSSTDNVSVAINLSALTDGYRYIVIQATDWLGRKKNSSTLLIIVDSQAPLVNFETQNQTWFNHSNPNIYFNITDQVDVNINYSLYLNRTFQKVSNTTNATTTNETLGPLSDGSYNITIQATDDANNSANYSIIIFIDTQAPSINLTYPDDDENFTTSSVSLNFTAKDNMDVSLTCNLTLDGSIQRSNFEAQNGQETNTTVTGLSEGTHYWNVTCWDNASNTNISETRSFNVFAPPIINLTAPPNGIVSNNQTQTFYFNVSDETGIYNCSLVLNGQINTTKPGSQITNNATNNFTVTLGEGVYNWSVRCYDNTTMQAEGNSEEWSIIIDLTAPYPNITTTNYSWFNTSTPLINFIIKDNFADPINYTFYVNGSVNVSGAVNNNTPSSDNLHDLNKNASYRVWLGATDDAGNSRNSTSIIIYVDTVKPSINLSAPGNGQQLNITSLQFNFTATDNMAPYMMCNLTISNGMCEYNINASSGVLQSITKSGFTSGTYYWNVTCADRAGNKNTSTTWNFTIRAPDLIITASNITFNNSSPEEGKNITVFANIYNLGGSPAYNVTVQFWRGDPDSGGVQIDGNKTIMNLTNGANFTINTTYTTVIGANNIFVVVDPPLLSNGSIAEENESNNKANNSFSVSLYQVYAGNTSELIEMEKQSINKSLFTWNVSNATKSNIFVTDTEANPSFTNLQAIGRDINNNSVSDDFEEIDIALGSTNYSDSINNTYTSNGSPRATKTYTVFSKIINNVPIINSTNTSNFVTGILWDKSDGNTEYNGTQDLLFITEINKQKQGSRGLYDFEIKVPALLRNYNAPGNSVAFYAELK